MKSSDFIRKEIRSLKVVKPIAESVEDQLPADFDPFKAAPKRVATTEVKSRTSVTESLLQVADRYSDSINRRAAQRIIEDAESERILKQMARDVEDDDKRPTNPYDRVDFKSPFKKERELQPAKQEIQPKPEKEQPEKTQEPITKKEKRHTHSMDFFKQVAGKMGEDLYSLSEWEYNYASFKSLVDLKYNPVLRSEEEPVLLNRMLRRVISSLGNDLHLTNEINDFLSQNREAFWHGGAIHAVIFNDNTGQLFFFVADPSVDFSTVVAGGYVTHQKRVSHKQDAGNLTKIQEDILNRVKDLGDQYVKAASRALETNYKSGYSDAVALRRQLLNALGLGEGYAPPLDRDPQDIEAEREHQAKKKQEKKS